MIIITGVSGAIGGKLFHHYYGNDSKTIGIFNKTSPAISNRTQFFKIDLTEYSQVESFIRSIQNDLSQICLINAAAITYDAFAHKCEPNKWQEVIETNLIGSFNIIRGLLPIMRQQEYGRIINLSSIVAQKGAIGTSAYAASKAGLWGMTKSIALENASKDILINNINLGYMEEGMTKRIPFEIQKSILEQIPLKRFGPICNLILAINFLIESTYITGTSIDINGGLY